MALSFPSGRQQPLFLALDQGGQGSRAAVYTARGECLSQASQPCQTRYPQDGFVEQDAGNILTSLETCLGKVNRELGEGTQAIAAAGLACQGSTLVCWDRKSGEALSPVISWQDLRGQPWLTHLSRETRHQTTFEMIPELTGLRLSAHYGASKFHWCIQHLPVVRQAASENRLVTGPLASYLLYQLGDTPVPQVDASHAQRTQLWSIQTRQWSDTLCRLFDIDPRWLPRCENSLHRFGKLRMNHTDIPIQVCLRDQAASLFGRGKPDPGTAYINLGTGAFLQRVVSAQPAPPGQMLSPLLLGKSTGHETDFTNQGETFTWEASVNGAAAALPWLTQSLGTELSPSRIDAAIKHCWSQSSSLPRYFINSCAGLAAPYWRTDIPPRFSPNLSVNESITAWIESLIFLLFTNLQLMQAQQPVGQIRISGGLSHCAPLCQGIADICRLPVYREDDIDSTLRGLGYLVAGEPAQWQNATRTNHQPPEETVFLPRPNLALNNAYHDWQNAMENAL